MLLTVVIADEATAKNCVSRQTKCRSLEWGEALSWGWLYSEAAVVIENTHSYTYSLKCL